jgi:hypothetical protein
MMCLLVLRVHLVLQALLFHRFLVTRTTSPMTMNMNIAMNMTAFQE